MSERPWWLRLTGTPPPPTKPPAVEPFGGLGGRGQYGPWRHSDQMTNAREHVMTFAEVHPRENRLARFPGIASLPRRALAWTIDSLLLGAVNVPVYVLVGRNGSQIAVAVAVGAVYLVPLIALYGQTLGAWIAGVQVVQLGASGLPGWMRSARRYLAFDGIIQVVGTFRPDAVVLAIVVIGGAAVLNRQRRGLQDLAAGVVVIELPRAARGR